ncbi:helix-turn-helix domain-containing protein [Parasutterella muris]|uniref:Uncharacterized protein n=1 Tax=Parasutterella muris TaxID=2565572 RepID=A0A6L6YI91_9BURK|nr:LysR family transcriptional regulator [Parasutterella muris]MVX57475.1 hypothetical protein [Parasutterella muris]
MKQKDNLLAWRALAVTVETGNITQTALLLDLDSAKVSRLIAGLEKRLVLSFLLKTADPLSRRIDAGRFSRWCFRY